MKRYIYTIFVVAAVLPINAQTRTWSLRDCLDYAVENNIQLKQSRNSILSGLEDTEQSRKALFPTLSASTSQGISVMPVAGSDMTYNGSYGLNADMTVYNGGRLRRSIRQQEVQNRRDSLSLAQNTMDIEISIIQAYIQCLYAAESVNMNMSTVEAAQQQRDRAEEMWRTGTVSKVDFSQIESQLFSDMYQLTTARNTLESYRLQLKQLLELGIDDEIELSGIEATEDDVLRLLPDKAEVYERALRNMPEVESGKLNITASELSLKQARSGYIPTVGLSAGIGTSNRNGTGNAFINQIQDNLNANAGVTVSIPILSGRKNKTAVNKARLSLDNSRLDALSTEKSVLKEIENTYIEAVNAQSQYVSAKQKEEYARESFSLTTEQFNLGMKNTVELINAKNEYLSAKQSLLQAKYMTLLNLAILDVYQGLN